MKFKRLATILMAAAMMVSLVACTGDNGENSETPVTWRAMMLWRNGNQPSLY